MNPIAKREAALKLMQSNGIWKANRCPPMLKILWRHGFDCPPPLMMSFAQGALVHGIVFGIVSTLASFFIRGAATLLPMELVRLVFTSVLFGLLLASYLRHIRLKHNIPLWRDFTPTE